MTEPDPFRASRCAREIAARVGALRERIADIVRRRAETDPAADDPYRGLRLTPETVGWLLDDRPARVATHVAAAGGGSGALPDETPGVPRCSRLDGLALTFGLTPLDVGLLVIALAAELDASFESFYGYLNDDVTRRHPTVGLALELCGRSTLDASARGRLRADAPLLAGRLLELDEPGRSFLGRELRVPDRVVAHLLGDDRPDEALRGLVDVTPAGDPPPGIAGVPPGLVAAIAGEPLLVQLRGSGHAAALAAAVLLAAGRGVVRLDLASGTTPDRDVAALLPLVVREARLRGAGLLVTAVGRLDPGELATAEVPVLLTGDVRLDRGAGRRPVVLDVAGDTDHLALWQAELGAAEPDLDLAATAGHYRLTEAGIRGAARSARTLAAIEGGPVTAEHVHRGARLENVRSMGQGVRHVEPAVGWPDLVLPPEPAERLRELIDRVRYRDEVLGGWGLRVGGGRGRGVTALFAGASGTGKTMAAEVVAAELGLDLYVVELASLVDKYVGETEKNLERLFAEADRVNGVLLFDEADAVFGKRSETRSANDRYANMESSYLLQRLESFDGVAVLTTNLRANIDDAFTRRLDLVVDFAFPESGLRRRLWRGCLAGAACDATEAELDRVADRFELTGGSIRSAATTAAYLAVAARRPVAAADLLAGARREYRKMGRLVESDIEV